MDLLMTGVLKMELVNGENLDSEFVQRIVIVGYDSDSEELLRMKFVQIWAVSIEQIEWYLMNVLTWIGLRAIEGEGYGDDEGVATTAAAAVKVTSTRDVKEARSGNWRHPEVE